MSTSPFIILLAAVSSLSLQNVNTLAQEFPSKAIRIVTSGVGGSSDFASRLLAMGISGGLGQSVIVENRGSGAVAPVVARAAPDGYILLGTPGTLWLSPLLGKVDYDPIRDFVPLSLTNRSPSILVVHPSLPVKNVRELIVLAKSRPGALNYSSGGAGATSHLAGELFNAMAGIHIVRVTYKTEASPGLLSGEVQMSFASAGGVMTHIKSGRLKALAVTSLQPSPLVPGMPTLAASGLPGFETGTIFGLFAPAKTPDAVVRRLNLEIVRFLSTAEAKQRFLDSGVEAVGSSPDEFLSVIKAEMTHMGKIIRDAGIGASD